MSSKVLFHRFGNTIFEYSLLKGKIILLATLFPSNQLPNSFCLVVLVESVASYNAEIAPIKIALFKYVQTPASVCFFCPCDTTI